MARLGKVLAGEETWGAYALDVLGHAALGAAWSVFPIAVGVQWLDWGFWLSWGFGLVPALAGGAFREWLQWRKADYALEKLHLPDRIGDTLHHALGPPIGWGVALLALTLLRLMLT